MGKVSIKQQRARIDRLVYEYWEVYRRGDFYRKAFKKSQRDKKELEKLGKADFNHAEYNALLSKFEQEYPPHSSQSEIP